MEEWLDVPMFFAGVSPASYERSLLEMGFELEVSELRTEVEPRYGVSEHRWVIARKPGE